MPRFIVLLSSFALCLCLTAHADTGYTEEIIVTVEFRDSSVLSVPSSISVLRPDEHGTNVNHLEEILNRAPNVNFASGASRGRFIQIRGIGERGQFSTPLNPSVGLIVDGVDLSGIGTVATLFDVEQVEVLRGPQGTLYGANALAGLINVVTADPADEVSSRIRAEVGDYGTFGIGGAVSGPLGDNAGYRISAQTYRDDGFIDNDFLNRDDTNDHREDTLRAKFVWGSETSNWQLALGRIDIDSGYDAFSLDNNRTTLSDEPGSDEQETTYVGLSTRMDTGKTEFQGSLTYADSDISYGYDEDWTFTDFDPIGYTSTDRYDRDRNTLTAEVRWLSQPESTLAGWDWVVGFYHFRQTVDLDRTYTFDAPFASSYDVDRYALYAEFSRQLNDNWRLSLGGRVEDHASDYEDDRGLNFDPDDTYFGGRILLERELDSGSFLYGSVTQGYKSNGFNIDGSLPADLREFDAETLWNIEFGYKAQLADDRLLLRTALFYMQRDDIQISTSTERPIDPNDPLSPVEFIPYTGNAAEGFNRGVEVELEFFATEQLTLFANLGILDTEFKDYIDNSGRDLDGREQAHAPSHQYFVGANFDFGGGWSAEIQFEGKDEFFFSDSHSAQSDSVDLINASVTYADDTWRAQLWTRNLTDEDYFVRGFFFGNDPRDFYTARPFTQLGEPARVGLTVEAQF
ncbi:MAG: TonB-dependent receptor [Pseudomonadota bacterium]